MPPARKPRAAVTIQDIALHLGVHKSTVSRAMDPARRGLISAEQLARIEAAARELGWRPNHAAAVLSTGKSRSIGVLLPDITNPVFPPILRGIEDALDAAGYIALLANTARHADAAEQAMERMLAMRVEGFIIASATRHDPWLQKLRDDGAAIVLVNRSDGAGQLPAVISDDALGMKLAVDHLVALGHRDIAHLGGPLSIATGLGRLQGFEQALRAQGLEAAAAVACSAYSQQAGHEGMGRLLADAAAGGPARPFTAVVAANDLLALGALQALRERGIGVPGQLSMVGHNDMPFLEQMSPPLSTIRIQHYEMGHRAAQLMLQAVGALPGSGEGTVLLQPELVVRGSTAPPP